MFISKYRLRADKSLFLKFITSILHVLPLLSTAIDIQLQFVYFMFNQDKELQYQKMLYRYY